MKNNNLEIEVLVKITQSDSIDPLVAAGLLKIDFDDAFKTYIEKILGEELNSDVKLLSGSIKINDVRREFNYVKECSE